MPLIVNMRCPCCGGKGIVVRVIKDVEPQPGEPERRREKRLPKLTGSATDRKEAEKIRDGFVDRGRKKYKSESYEMFLRMVSYEAHSSFWMSNKNSTFDQLVAKLLSRNPSALDLATDLL